MTARRGPSTRASRAAALIAAAALALAACTSADGGTGTEATPGAADAGGSTTAPDPGQASPSAAAGVDPATAVESFTMVTSGGELAVDVYPLVRSGKYVVLTYDLRPTKLPDPSGDFYLSHPFDGTVTSRAVDGGGVRLVDLESSTAYHVGVNGDGGVVGVAPDLAWVPVDGLRVQRAYQAPPAGTESLGALFPGQWVADVPVVDGEVPPASIGAASADPSPRAEEPSTSDDAEEAAPIDLGAVVEAPVVPVTSFSRELEGAVQVTETTSQVEVSLGSDVLFASGSAELGPQAQEVLAAAAAHLQGHAPGVIDVVGHTDDVGDDASNQDLSLRRAQAVVDALTPLVDTASYTLRPSGRGETEPLVPNDTDANKQLNRRVVLTLTSTVTTRTEVTSAGELPPFEEGPVATGSEGVTLTNGRPIRLTAPQARRFGDALLVTLQATALDHEIDSSFGVGTLSGIFSYRGDDTVYPTHALGLAVVSGSTAVYPLDYPLGEPYNGLQPWQPLADLNTLRRIDGGQTLTFVGLYPDIEGAATIAVQVGQGLGTEPFRLTDIPVVDGEE